MKRAFEILSDDNEEDQNEELGDNVEENNPEETDVLLKQWTPHHFKFDGWFGCAAHQIQLVIHDGYKELTNYHRVQAAFSKAKAISSLSHKSSHFVYALPAKIPVPCDTRWNSHFKLHEHILKHFDSINEALKKVGRSELVVSRNSLSGVVAVMEYFLEATNILQQEGNPTSNQVIPVVDSLENALIQTSRENAAVNALCECLL